MPVSTPRRSAPRLPPAWVWALAYAAALLVIAPSAEIRHADDYHYLEASLQMSLGGDWVVPQTPDGRPRLRKPVFTYWPLALSFKTLGPSMLSARLPYLLAGAATVWLIAWFGARLADRESARLAAMILAACLPWMLAGLRTIPDVWLTLFMTLSAGGFLLLLNGTHRRLGPWLAWIGLGLAVATKGLVALLVAPALAVVWWRWRGDVVWRELFHRPAVMAGAAIGLLWYAAVAIRLGPSALLNFTADQLNATLTVRQVVDHCLGYLVYLPVALLPFTLLGLGIRPRDWRWLGRGPARRAVAGYALTLTVTLVAVFSFAYQFSGGRYMMPALPWLALLLGMLFHSAIAEGRPRRAIAAAVAALVAGMALLLCLGVSAVGVATGLLEGGESLVWRVAVISVAAVAVLLVAHGGPRAALVLPACMTLALPPTLFGMARPALPDTAERIVNAVRETDPPGPVIMADEGSLAGVVRVMSAGRVEFTEKVNPPPAPNSFGALIVARGHLPGDGTFDACERREIANDFRRIRSSELLDAIRAGEGDAFLASRRQPYLMIRCPDRGDAESKEPGAAGSGSGNEGS